MRITSLALKNFLTFDAEGVELADVGETFFLVGPNGAGKSSAFRAIIFLVQALSRVAPHAGPYVHGQDLTKHLEIDVGVRLSESERSLAVNTALIAIGRDVRIIPGNSNTDEVEANRVVRLVIRRCKALFEPLFSGEVHYCVRSSPGYAQSLETFVRVASPGGDLCIDDTGKLSRAPFRSNSWSVVSLPDEIYTRIKTRIPDAFVRGKPRLENLDSIIREVADSMGAKWLYDSLAPRDPGPVSFNLEAVLLDIQPNGQPVIDSEGAFELEGFVRSRGEGRPQVTLFGVLAQIFESSIAILSDERTKLAALGGGHPWAPWDPGTAPVSFDLPKQLYDLKNSPDLESKERFHQLQAEFEQLAGVSFDVVWESRTIQSPIPQTPARTVGLPVLAFSEQRMSYPGSLAAAGHCELLLVLGTLAGFSNSVFLLDEPALNLHPVKQHELLGAMTRLAIEGQNQLMVITHSPEFVNSGTIPNAVRFSRAVTGTIAKSLRIADHRHAGRVGKLIDVDPEVLGALFADRVVLVEGHAEAVSLPVWLAKCEASVDFGAAGVLFLNVKGKESFPWYAGAMAAWGIPHRLIGDSDSADILGQFEGRGFAYPERDFSHILVSYAEAAFVDAKRTWGGGDKNPLIARAVALQSDPPPPIRKVWEFLRPFVMEGLQ